VNALDLFKNITLNDFYQFYEDFAAFSKNCFALYINGVCYVIEPVCFNSTPQAVLEF